MAKPETQATIVDMLNGDKVTFTGKSRMVKTLQKGEDGSLAVRLDFVNGETRIHKLNPALLADYALHGASQKLGDETSGIQDVEDAVEAIDQLMQRLDAGDWNVGATGGTGMAGASILARALVEVTSQPIAAVREYLGKLDAKTKVALRAAPEVAPVVQRLEAEKAARAAARGKATAATVDTGAILAGLKAAPAA